VILAEPKKVTTTEPNDFLLAALKELPPKPSDDHKQFVKKRYSELLSEKVAYAFAAELRRRGLKEARPAVAGEIGVSGAERRMSGGIGAKKVDVTWATEESGLLLAISIKSINFRDQGTRNFQKNLSNRRNDLLYEAVTLHRRFPYSVLGGFFFLDKDADLDGSSARKSTFINAHERLKIFTGRSDPSGREEQYERLYVVLVDANPFNPSARISVAGRPAEQVSLNGAFAEMLSLVADRDPDFYEMVEGELKRRR
jgi:hypothetical protein